MRTIPQADSGLSCFARQVAPIVLQWALLSFVLNLLWEIMQSPLYVFAGTGGWFIAYSIAHCTAGDVFISVGGFFLAVLMLRDPAWLVTRPWAGGAITSAFGLLYTAYSEWFNVYQLGNWGYAANMPLAFGIGVAPLLQWLVLPALTVMCFRAIGCQRSES